MKIYVLNGSYFSMKGLLALEEKGVKYEEQFMLVAGGRDGGQNSPEFLKMNPEGTVPVLEDGDTTVPGSLEIVRYLDRIYPDKPALYPEFPREITQLHDRVLGVEIELVSFGAAYHPHLYPNLSWFFRLFFGNFKETFELAVGEMRKNILLHPEVKKLMETKIAKFQKRSADLQDEQRVRDELRDTETILDDIETFLARRTSDSGAWLAGPEFTVLDISLIVLLNRLQFMGLDHWYGPQARPHLAAYWGQVEKRPSYQKICVGHRRKGILIIVRKLVVSKLMPVVGVAALAGLAYCAYKKFSSA